MSEVGSKLEGTDGTCPPAAFKVYYVRHLGNGMPLESGLPIGEAENDCALKPVMANTPPAHPRKRER